MPSFFLLWVILLQGLKKLTEWSIKIKDYDNFLLKNVGIKMAKVTNNKIRRHNKDLMTTTKPVVLITGGNSGIGASCAKRFADENYNVVICGRRESECQKIVNDIRGRGATADYFVVDLAEEAQIKALFSWLGSSFSRLDCLVNNAAIEGDSFIKTADYSESMFDQVMAVNVKAPWLCMKFAINIMKSHKGGSILNVCSLAGLRSSVTGGCAYTATKHALVGLTKVAAKEYALDNIRINAVCPAFVRTPLATEVLGDRIEEFSQMHPIGRICESHEVADAIYWLCSPEASFITGVTLPVDGGVMA
jgi:NAD(P)-dependent dehydrogenase (short-subunit alcohol dehydrogenase family)